MSLQSRLIIGDIDAFEKVYRLHFKKVFNVVRKYMNTDCYIDDITQEVFLKLWKNKHHISTEMSIEQQLFTITKNLVFNHLRKKVNEKKVLSDYVITASNYSRNDANIEDVLKEQLGRVKSIVKKLPKKQQKIFTMYRSEGLTYQEIATSLNISKNTVSNHLNTAMSFIKKNVTFFLF